MLSHVQWVSLIGSILFLLVVLDTVRRQRLREAYAILWVFSTILMIIISLRLDILHFISKMVGIQYPPATLFLFLIIGIVLLLFQYSIVISKHNEKITALTQEIALLKEELNKKK